MSKSTNLDLLSVADVAALLKISPRSVRRLIERRRISSYKIMGCVRIDAKDVSIYLDTIRSSSVDEPLVEYENT